MSFSWKEREKVRGSPLMSPIMEDVMDESSDSGSFCSSLWSGNKVRILSVFPRGHRFMLAMSAIQHGRVYS